MSFSSIVKNELCRVESHNHCCMLSQLAAVIRTNGIIEYDLCTAKTSIKVTTENAGFARMLFTVIKNLYSFNPEITTQRIKKLKKHTLHIIKITATNIVQGILTDICIEVDTQKNIEKINFLSYYNKISNEICCKRVYLRGAFLASGAISDPGKTYHLELVAHNQTLADELQLIMIEYGLNAKIIKRKDNYIVYLKEGGNIADFLNIIGAHSALMSLENIRILKEVRNNVNRVVNCETANLEKTINASVRQIENIKYIIKTIGLDKLPENLREIAGLRLEYGDSNLKELGEMLSPPLGKSGVNHRLRRLDEIAENIRNSKGDS